MGVSRGSKSSGHPPVKKESTAKWPGVPGKTGPDRSNGVKKLKQSAKQEGL